MSGYFEDKEKKGVFSSIINNNEAPKVDAVKEKESPIITVKSEPKKEINYRESKYGPIDKLDLSEVIKKTPLDKILVETDCPYLTPLAEGKDKRNEPIFVKHVIQKIADIKGINFQDAAEVTAQNAKKLFVGLKQ